MSLRVGLLKKYSNSVIHNRMIRLVVKRPETDMSGEKNKCSSPLPTIDELIQERTTRDWACYACGAKFPAKTNTTGFCTKDGCPREEFGRCQVDGCDDVVLLTQQKTSSALEYDVIFLAGYPGVGKDTVGAELCRRFARVRDAFADALKDDAAIEFKIERSIFDDVKRKNDKYPSDHVHAGKTPRDLLIQLGKERRSKNDAHYADHIMHRIKKRDYSAPLVVTDLGMHVERKAQLALPKTIRSIAVWVKSKRVPTKPFPDGREIEAADCDVIFDNDGTLEELRKDPLSFRLLPRGAAAS